MQLHFCIYYEYAFYYYIFDCRHRNSKQALAVVAEAQKSRTRFPYVSRRQFLAHIAHICRLWFLAPICCYFHAIIIKTKLQVNAV